MELKKLKKHEVKNQTDAILWHLQEFGSITSWEAIKDYGATRLSAIIFNLRKDGHNINSLPLKKINRFGKTTKIAKYIYEKPIRQYAQAGIWG